MLALMHTRDISRLISGVIGEGEFNFQPNQGKAEGIDSPGMDRTNPTRVFVLYNLRSPVN